MEIEEIAIKDNHELYKGILLILLSALFTSVGQLCWKIAGSNYILLILGFVLYGLGAMLMILSFKYGEISVLHPLLSMSYVLAIVLGYIILKESIPPKRIIGVILVIVGMVFMGLSGMRKRE